MISGPKLTKKMSAPVWMVVAIVIIEITFVKVLPTSSAFTTTRITQQHLHRVLATVPSSSMETIDPITTGATPFADASSQSTETLASENTTTSTQQKQRKTLVIVPPDHGFRNTIGGGTEVSIVSMNLLAPFYNSLQLNKKTTSDYERWEFLDRDRRERVPLALNMAKRTNADVLCLQEIEGGKLGEILTAEGSRGEFTLRDDIRDWLAKPTIIESADGAETTVLEGYDAFVWSPLNPQNKRGDVVGLCVAWRSQRHSLVEWEGYKRGMVCRLQENDNDKKGDSESPNVSFALANLHLPARPSNVLGRLKTMSRTIRKLSDLESKMRMDRAARKGDSSNTVDGLMVVAGDFNSDQNSVAARLLTHGHTNYGNVRDRNYKAKVTKAAATDMSHPYRFIDSYEHGNHPNDKDLRFKEGSFRDLYAPVTVSLKGRGPGIMDHLFYATGKAKTNYHPPKLQNVRKNPSRVAVKSSGASTVDALSASLLQQHIGGTKRTKRRKKGESRGGGGNEGMASAARYVFDPKAKIQIESVLATVNFDASNNGHEERLQVIRDGLPNLKEGFASDHLPVGALFSAAARSATHNHDDVNVTINNSKEIRNNEETEDFATSKLLLVEGESKNLRTAVDEPADSRSDNDGDGDDEHRSTGIPLARKAGTSARRSETAAAATTTVSGISSAVKRRRSNSRASYGLRRRHNLVLNALTDWLVGRGATSVVLDKPLYKNDLLSRTLDPSQSQKLKKKSRAPDLMCVVVKGDNGIDTDADAATVLSEECLVVVEVAVSSDPTKVRSKKQSKYQDLVELLSKGNKRSNQSCYFATVVVGDDGSIPDGTRSDIRFLARLTTSSNDDDDSEATEAETEQFSAHLQALVSSCRVQ